MSTKLSTFICQNCGSETSQYFGRCLNCNSWNSIVEEIKIKSSKYQGIKDKKNSKKSIPFSEISSKKISRFTSGFREFDLVLGGGRVSDGTFKVLQQHFSDEEILELTYITCTYDMHATICKALRLEYDDVGERVREIPIPDSELGDIDFMKAVDKNK